MWIVLFLSKDYEANSSSDYLLRENTIVQTNRLQQCFLMGERKEKKKCVCVVGWGVELYSKAWEQKPNTCKQELNNPP